MEDINGYDLSRNWFDWCFENPEKIKPEHIAIYFFAIEHCNRLGWKKKFGFPTKMVMEAIGIKRYQTYISYFNDLVEWGFLELVEKSVNQYSSNIISIKSAKPKTAKALDKALIKHSTKQPKSTDSIDKQDNKEPKKELHKIQIWINEKLSNVRQMGTQMTYEQCEAIIETYNKKAIQETLEAMDNHKDLLKKYTSVYLTFKNWIKNHKNPTKLVWDAKIYWNKDLTPEEWEIVPPELVQEKKRHDIRRQMGI